MQIKIYITKEKVREILKENGYSESTLLMLAKVDLGLKKNPCYLPEYSKIDVLPHFLRRRVYWKTESEKNKILYILSGILFCLKNVDREKLGYLYYYSSSLMNVRPKGAKLEFHYPYLREDELDTLICYTPEKILSRNIKKLIGC